MTHVYHDELAGYDTRQIWKDGCAECEVRGKAPALYLTTLDNHTFKRAWQRAADWNTDKEVGAVSTAEMSLLNLIWTFQVMFQRTIDLPIGEFPEWEKF